MNQLRGIHVMTSLVLLQLGCSSDEVVGRARTMAPLEEEGGEEAACEEEIPPPLPPEETLCLTVKRGGFGAVSDAALGDERTPPGDAPELIVGRGRSALVRFDLASIPRGMRVMSARLVLDEIGRGDAAVRVHALAQRWDERELRPDAQLAFDREPVAMLDGAPRASAALGNLVHAWVEGLRDNDGLLLASDDGMSTFVGSDSDVAYLRPGLEVCLQAKKKDPDAQPELKIEEVGDIVCLSSGPGQDIRACGPDGSSPTWRCVDVAHDEGHCGRCDVRCGRDETCHDGRCLAIVDEVACYEAGGDFCTKTKLGTPVCTDLGTSHAHCGACDNACPDELACIDGTCACPGGASLCAGACVYPATDASHCGACGNACAEGEVCASGQCLAPSNTFLIGDDNAKWFEVDGGALDLVHTAAYKRSWTHVTSAALGGLVPALVFYSRETGAVKVVSHAPDGQLVATMAAATFAQKWDHVVSPKVYNGLYNLLLYSRKDGELKSVDATADGDLDVYDATLLPAPNGDEVSDAAVFRPNRHAWDNIVPVRLPASIAGADAFFAYHQVTGRGVLFVRSLPNLRWTIVRDFDLQPRWDEITAGDLDGDAIDDLVFYDQDTGLMKVAFMSTNWFIKTTASLGDVGTSHGARLVAGQLDGVGPEDFVLYQTDGGDRFEKGRLRRWTGVAGALPVVTLDDGQVKDGWTHLVPVALSGGAGRPGLLFYSNQHVVDVEYIVMRKPPEGVVPAPTQTSWTWSPSARRALARHQAALRKTFAPAGIAFNVILSDQARYMPEAAVYDCTEEDEVKQAAARAAVVQWVTDNVAKTSLPVLLAYDGGGGVGCSGQNVNFVREKYAYDKTDTTGYLVEPHSAHEIGHYFGLGHSHVVEDKETPWPYDVSFIEHLLYDDSDIFKLDTDVGGSWQHVWDTPPTLTQKFWTNPQYDLTTLAGNQAIQAARCPTATYSPPPLAFENEDGDPVDMVLYPPVASGYSICPGSERRGLARLSRDQVRGARHTLYTLRRDLIQ